MIKSLGIFIGRFAPLHYGHLEVIKYGEANFDDLLIIAGSANTINKKTPYSIQTRMKMVRSVTYKPCFLIYDYPGNNDTWAYHVKDVARAVTNEVEVTLLSDKYEWYFDLFPDWYKLLIPSPYRGLTATLVRELISNNIDITPFVPKSTLEILNENLSLHK